MGNIKNRYDQDGCIDTALTDNPNSGLHRIFWQKEIGGANLLMDERGDDSVCIDRFMDEVHLTEVHYHAQTKTLSLHDRNNNIYNYHQDEKGNFKPEKNLSESPKILLPMLAIGVARASRS